MPPRKLGQFRFILSTAAIVGILLFNSWFIYLNFQRVSAQEEQINHTAQVIGELDQIMSAAKDAETGVRGFLLTNKDEYLEPYRQGTVQALEHTSRLKMVITDNLTQSAAAESIEMILVKRFDILKNLLEAFRHDPNKIDRQTVLMSEGKTTMDNLRAQVDEMKITERRYLEDSKKKADSSKTSFLWTLLITTSLSVLAIAFSFTQIARHQKKVSRESMEKGISAEVARLCADDLALEAIGYHSLTYLSKAFGFLAGRLYMIDQGLLRVVSSHAVKDYSSSGTDGGSRKNERIPELVRAAFLRNETWMIRDIPQDYWHISSGLGEAKPAALSFLPFSFQGKTLGVFELASFAPLTEEQFDLLAKLSDTFGVGLNAAQSKETLQALLERTQHQAEELEAQQEELKANNEELEQQARAMESQQQSLTVKNRELEFAQAQLESKAQDLVRSSQYKSDFLAKMSHELRTPLNGLLILSTLLIENKEKNLTEQQRNFARSIQSAGNDLLMLINDVLDLSKIEARKLSLRAEEVALETIFASKRRTFQQQAEAKNLSLVMDLPDSIKNFQLHTDRRRLDQILRNFLSNAIKFTEFGEVKLSAEVDSSKKFVTFTVSDTGIGIAADKREAIFEAFEQADSSVDRKYGGTGLGLTISRELAALLGGEISLQSKEGEGSHFSVKIPARLETSDVTQTVREPLKIVPTREEFGLVSNGNIGNDDRVRNEARNALKDLDPKKKSILIIEDDDKFRASIVEAVKSYDFSAIEVGDGEVAMAVLNERPPDAVLLDIKLPGISGLGILEMIKQLPHLRHIPVHMISGLDYQHNALRMGALGYLTKPVTIEKVRAALNRIEDIVEKKVRRVLLIEDDDRQNKAISELISGKDIEVVAVKTGKNAAEALKKSGFDCIILDLTLPDVSGFDLLSELSTLDISLPPVVIYTGKDLSEKEEAYLRKYSESIIIKGARSPERLLDEVNLFLHRVESLLPTDKREMLTHLRSQEKAFEGKTVLVVDDDIRNIFALTSALEAKGLHVMVARNGIEALDALNDSADIDLVLMDIMMPKMDGFEAMRRIRSSSDPRLKSLPIVALTAKAMREDHEKCMDAGASDYLQKPVNLDNLVTVMRVWLAPKGFMT